MTNHKQEHLRRVSKYLSYLLRHHPETIGLSLDVNGWANIDELVRLAKDYSLSREIISIVVETNDKQRFAMSADGQSIRANQGHSINVDLALAPQVPPPVLYHGTAEQFVDKIFREGLQKQQRHHVHLSESLSVARAVGQRHGKAVLLSIDTQAMLKDGFIFYLSDNHVWLCDEVPIQYLSRLST